MALSPALKGQPTQPPEVKTYAQIPKVLITLRILLELHLN